MFRLAGAPPAAHPIRFRNVAPGSGLDFVMHNHATRHKYLIETMAGGVAVFDYDGDGRPDIFCTNGAPIPGLQKKTPRDWNRLYHNDGNLHFTDVTEKAGLAGTGYSIGAAAADYDNDGDIDLFVGGVRHNRLYRNNGDGTFTDVSQQAGIRTTMWSEGAAWFDYDNDGYLDLFVASYLKWDPSMDYYCGDRAMHVRAYCHPKLFEGLPSVLYHNNGDGTFTDVSAKAGIASHIGKAMSIVVADYDLDGWMDVFVTNDKIPNFLFHNLGNGTFEEVALLAGGALQDNGMAVSSMGADFRDYNNDGYPDIVFAALAGETFPIFVNDGHGGFQDGGYMTGLAPLTTRRSGWSVGLYDLDNDGWKDLFVSNSHVNDTVSYFEASQYKLTNTVYANLGNGKFADVSKGSGLDQGTPLAHRGAGFADFNGDGKIDVVVVSLEGPAELWLNTTPTQNTWLDFRLRGTKSNRDGIGARIRIGDQWNQMTTSVGYVSSSYGAVHFGTGTAKKVDKVEIFWPSGIKQVLRNVSTDQVVQVTEPRQ